MHAIEAFRAGFYACLSAVGFLATLLCVIAGFLSIIGIISFVVRLVKGSKEG